MLERWRTVWVSQSIRTNMKKRNNPSTNTKQIYKSHKHTHIQSNEELLCCDFFSTLLRAFVLNPIKYLHVLFINDVNANWTFFQWICCRFFLCTIPLYLSFECSDYWISTVSTKYAENVKMNTPFSKYRFHGEIYYWKCCCLRLEFSWNH